MTTSEYNATWLKAVAFINRALDDTDEFEERAFWAACSLKLLANAAVIASPPPSSSPRTLARRDNVFRRCQSMTSRFDAARANGFEASRGRYLDSGDAFSSAIPPSQWWANYWPLVEVLLEIQEKHLADFVGVDRQDEIREILRRSAEATAARVRALMDQAVEVAQRRWRGEVTADESRAIVARTQTHHSFAVHQQCPACADVGALRGDIPVDGCAGNESSLVATEVFVCPTCGLFLRGPDAIRHAHLPESFTLSHGSQPCMALAVVPYADGEDDGLPTGRPQIGGEACCVAARGLRS